MVLSLHLHYIKLLVHVKVLIRSKLWYMWYGTHLEDSSSPSHHKGPKGKITATYIGTAGASYVNPTN